jgi:hypothetical protein
LVSGDLLWRTEIGTGGPDAAPENIVYTKTTKNTGETEVFIRAPGATSGYNLKILPNGQTDLNVANKTTVQIKPTGEVTLNVGPGNCILNIKADGSVSLISKGTIQATADKAITITTKASLTANVTGAFTANCANATIKANKNVLKGGSVTDNVANNDPITGIGLKGVGGVDLS